MPWSPLKLCTYSGCNARIASTLRHCDVHAKLTARQREARRSARVVDGEKTSGGGRKVDWRALRAEVLARDPWCKLCDFKSSKHADHIIAKRDGGQDIASNLQGVCHSCHSRKTARHDGGFGNARSSATKHAIVEVRADGTKVVR